MHLKALYFPLDLYLNETTKIPLATLLPKNPGEIFILFERSFVE